jgi:hypothetical protein
MMAAMLKHLRRAMIVLSLAACLLFIAIWVRTLFAQDVVCCPLSATSSLAISSRGDGLGVFYQEFGIRRNWRFASLRPDVPNIQPHAYCLAVGLCRAKGELYGFVVPYWLLIIAYMVIPTLLVIKSTASRFVRSIQAKGDGQIVSSSALSH